MPLKATLDNEKYYTFNSINNLIPKKEYSSIIKIFLLILNSRILNWYYCLKFSNKSDLTVNISKTFLEVLPIPEIPLSDLQPFIEIADLMLSLNKTLHEKIDAFVKLMMQK
jgi:adenine-specific DNA-methyltransferase